MMKVLMTFLISFFAVSNVFAQGYNDCPEPSRPFFRWTKPGALPAGPPLQSYEDVLNVIRPVQQGADLVFNKAWHLIAHEQWKVNYQDFHVMWDAAQQGEGANLVRTEIKPCDQFADMIYGIPNRPAGMTVLFDPLDKKPISAWVWKIDDRRELVIADACQNILQKVHVVEDKPEPPVQVTEERPQPTRVPEPKPEPPKETIREKETIVHGGGQPSNQQQATYVNVYPPDTQLVGDQPDLPTIPMENRVPQSGHYTASVGPIVVCNLQGKFKFVNGTIADGDGKCYAGAPGFARNFRDVGFGIGAMLGGGGLLAYGLNHGPDQTTITTNGVSAPETIINPNITPEISNNNGFSPEITNNPTANSNASAESGATASADSGSSATADARDGNLSVVVDNPPPTVVVNNPPPVVVQQPPPTQPPPPVKNPFTPPPNSTGRPQN